MLGWTMVFGLVALTGASVAWSGMDSSVSVKAASVLFSALFLASLFSRVVGGRAR